MNTDMTDMTDTTGTETFELDMAIEADDDAGILTEARTWLEDEANVPPSAVVAVELVSASGPAGGWPIVRFVVAAACAQQVADAYGEDLAVLLS